MVGLLVDGSNHVKDSQLPESNVRNIIITSSTSAGVRQKLLLVSLSLAPFPLTARFSLPRKLRLHFFISSLSARCPTTRYMSFLASARFPFRHYLPCILTILRHLSHKRPLSLSLPAPGTPLIPSPVHPISLATRFRRWSYMQSFAHVGLLTFGLRNLRVVACRFSVPPIVPFFC